MKAATLAQIKKELKDRDPDELLQIILRLGRFKKDNKELLSYLLFDAGDENGYVQSVKYIIDDEMEEINTSHLYYAKKSLRKILRNLNKYIRYSGNKQTEVEVLIYFCQSMKESGIAINRSRVLTNMYERLLLRIKKVLASLDEDLQADYQLDVETITIL